MFLCNKAESSLQIGRSTYATGPFTLEEPLSEWVQRDVASFMAKGLLKEVKEVEKPEPEPEVIEPEPEPEPEPEVIEPEPESEVIEPKVIEEVEEAAKPKVTRRRRTKK